MGYPKPMLWPRPVVPLPPAGHDEQPRGATSWPAATCLFTESGWVLGVFRVFWVVGFGVQSLGWLGFGFRV